jgi:hypothetical protein
MKKHNQYVGGGIGGHSMKTNKMKEEGHWGKTSI